MSNGSTRFLLEAQDVSRAAFDSFKAGAAGAEAQLTELQRELAATSATFAEFQTKLKEGARFTSDLNFRVDSIGKTNAELLAMQAAQLGVSNTAKPMIDKLREAESANKSGAMSAAAYTAALRGVPAQVTDIVTSLQAGQRPMQVLMQQGGQLKDMFGGIGPAAKALGGYVLGLVNPFTVAAAGAAVLAYAYHSGSQEATEYNKAIIMSGNAAGVTAGQLQLMAEGVSHIVGTQHGAAAVLAEMATTGQIAGENLQWFAAIAIELERTAGVPISNTVKTLAELGDTPVEASVRLNKQYHYLTAAIYEQIKALEDRGQKDAAGELAQNAYAEAMGQRAAQIKKHLGTLETAWQGLKDIATKTWDAMLGIGRPDTMATIGQTITALEGLLAAQEAGGARVGGNPEDTKARLAAARALSAEMFRQSELEARNAQGAADTAKYAEAEQDYRAQTDKYLNKNQQRDKEIEAARALAARRDQSTEEKRLQVAKDLEQQIANIKKKTRDTEAESAEKDVLSGRIEALKRSAELQQELAKRTQDEITHQYRTGSISQIQYIQQTSDAEMVGLQAKREALAQEIAIAETIKNSHKKVAELKGQLELQDAKIDSAKIKREQTLLEVAHQRALALSIAQFNDQEQHDRDVAAAIVEQGQAYNSLQLSVSAYARSVSDANEQVDFEVTMLGKSSHEQAIANEQRRVELRLREQLRDIEERARGGRLDPQQVATEEARVRKAAAEDSAKVETKVFVDEWSRANQQIGSDLYDQLVHRGTSASKKLEALFENLILRPTIMGVLQPVSGALATGATSVTNSLTGSVLGNAGGSALTSYGGSLAKGFGSEAMNGTLLSNIGAGYAGVGGSYASTVGAGLATDAMGATVAEGTAAATIGSGSAVGAGLAAVPVYGWIALAALAAYEMMQGGETRSGGQYSDATFLQGPSGGEVNGDQTRAAIAGTIGSTNALLKALGSAATVANFQSGFETSKEGKGFAYGGGQLSTGQIFGQGVGGHGFENRRGSMSPEEAAAAFGEELKQATLQALQAADVPGKLGDYLRQLGDIDTLSGGALDTALAKVTKALTEKGQLEAQIYDLTATDAEKLTKTRNAERAAIDDSNLALLEQVYALQDQKTATEQATAAAQAQTEALSGARNDLSSAYDKEKTALETTRDRLDGFTKKFISFRDSLLLGNLSPLTPGQRYAEAANQYASTVADLSSSDTTVAAAAMDRFDGVAQSFLEASQVYNASSDAYTRDFQNVVAQTNKTVSLTQAQYSVAVNSLGKLDQMVSGLLEVKGAVMSVEEAIWRLGGTSPGSASAVTSAYQTLLNRAPDNSGLNYWSARLATGMTLDELNASLKASPEYVSGHSHAAGLDRVPYNNYRATLHVDETVLNREAANEWRYSRSGGSNQGFISEIRALRDEVRSLKQQIAHGTSETVGAHERSAERIVQGVGQAAGRGAWVQGLQVEAGRRR